MLLNGVLFNSEAWHGVTDQDIKTLESIDEHLLRSLVKGHAKTPLEFLHLDAGAVPMRFLLSSRRMIYHQNILKRDDKELVKKQYKAPVENPAIANTSTNSYKKFIKKKIRLAAFKYLLELKGSHSKVRSIEYKKLETQKYLTSPIFSNEDVEVLFALRSRALNCKANFKNKCKETKPQPALAFG